MLTDRQTHIQRNTHKHKHYENITLAHTPDIIISEIITYIINCDMFTWPNKLGSSDMEHYIVVIFAFQIYLAVCSKRFTSKLR